MDGTSTQSKEIRTCSIEREWPVLNIRHDLSAEKRGLISTGKNPLEISPPPEKGGPRLGLAPFSPSEWILLVILYFHCRRRPSSKNNVEEECACDWCHGLARR